MELCNRKQWRSVGVLEAARPSQYLLRLRLVSLPLLAALLLLAGIADCTQEDTAGGRAKEQSTFRRYFWSTADADHYKLSEDGEVAELVLDRIAASGFASHTRYLFGRISIEMKLHPGDSAGTVTTFYVSFLLVHGSTKWDDFCLGPYRYFLESRMSSQVRESWLTLLLLARFLCGLTLKGSLKQERNGCVVVELF
jgi:hypothetical protein